MHSLHIVPLAMPLLELLTHFPYEEHERIERQPDPQRLLEEIVYRAIEVHTVAALPGEIS